MSNKTDKPTFIQRFEGLEQTVLELIPIIEQINKNNVVLKDEIFALSEQIEAMYEIAEKNNSGITMDQVESHIVAKRIKGVEDSVQSLVGKGEVVDKEVVTEESVILIEAPKAKLARVLQKVSLIEDQELKSEIMGQKVGFQDSNGHLVIHRILEIVKKEDSVPEVQ